MAEESGKKSRGSSGGSRACPPKKDECTPEITEEQSGKRSRRASAKRCPKGYKTGEKKEEPTKKEVTDDKCPQFTRLKTYDDVPDDCGKKKSEDRIKKTVKQELPPIVPIPRGRPPKCKIEDECAPVVTKKTSNTAGASGPPSHCMPQKDQNKDSKDRCET